MALFEEIEPPSQDDQRFNITIKINKIINCSFVKNVFLVISKLANFALHALVDFYLQSKKFIFNADYLPHAAMILLGLVVAGVNINQKVIAKAYFSELVSVSPDVQFSVSENVDSYTPLINNDAKAVETLLLASSMSGFVNTKQTVSTEVTENNPILASQTSTPDDNSDKQIFYVIKDGDTLTGLGWKYGIKLATLKYVNDITDENYLKPGIKIKIPQRGYEVSNKLIAKKENEKKAKLAQAQRNTVTRNSSTNRTNVNYKVGSKVNGYPYGYCTYYVATRRSVPSSWGNAKAWLNSAQRAGYQTGSEPAVGAIVVTKESWWGHVAFVESVNGSQVTISEMNAKGWGVTSSRTISTHDSIVRGYIY